MNFPFPKDITAAAAAQGKGVFGFRFNPINKNGIDTIACGPMDDELGSKLALFCHLIRKDGPKQAYEQAFGPARRAKK